MSSYRNLGCISNERIVVINNCVIGTNLAIARKPINCWLPRARNQCEIATEMKYLALVTAADGCIIGANAAEAKDNHHAIHDDVPVRCNGRGCANLRRTSMQRQGRVKWFDGSFSPLW